MRAPSYALMSRRKPRNKSKPAQPLPQRRPQPLQQQPQRTPASFTHRRWLPGTALIVMTLLVYLGCLRGPLLWDDTEWFGAMDWKLRGLAGLWRLWTVPDSVQQFYPVTTTSFWLDDRCWDRWTLPPHLENVLLHGGSSVLFWMLLVRLRVRGAWMAAALFAVHPVMVESVAWITERKNTLCTFFSLLALLVHGAAAGWWESRLASRPRSATVLALILFVLASLSKISVAVLPGVVLVIGWWRGGFIRWRADGFRVLSWVVALLPLIVLTSRLEQAQVTGGDSVPPLTFLERLLLAGQLPWFYLGKLAWPQHLCVIYERWPLDTAAWWQWAGAAALAVVLVLLAWSKWRGALAVTLLFLGTLFPVLGFFEVNGMKYAWAADRWAYLPAMAVFAGTGWLLALVRWSRARFVLAAFLLAACGILCAKQAALYGDMDRFWQAAIAGNPAPWKARNDYSSQLMDVKRHEDARRQLESALEIAPDYVAAHVNLASALVGLGRPEDALVHLDRALELRPAANPATWFNKGIILRDVGRQADAETAFRKAVEQNPAFHAARSELGNLLILTGRLDEAMSCFQTLLQELPGDARTVTSIGNVHYLQGRLSEALSAFVSALRSDPDVAGTLSNAAWILATAPEDKLRDGPTAVRHAMHAAELTQRADPGVLQVLAAALAESGDFEKAVDVSKEAAGLARAQGKEALAGNITANQMLFEKKQPCRIQAAR